MKITFINPYYHNIWESIGVGYIISYCLKNYKDNLEINFFQGMFDSDEEIIKGSFNSDIIAFSCTSPSFMRGVDLSLKIKKLNPKIKSVFGGWHVTALKDKSLINGVDQIVIGEGEKAFLDILSLLQSIGNRFWNSSD